MPDWVAERHQTFFAFLAGYIDAEGYIKVCLPHGYRTPQARLEVRSYDANLLQALASGLNARNIPCSLARIRVRAVYENCYGVRSNRVLWGFGVSRKESLAQLFGKLDPYLRHGRRRRGMLKAWALVDPLRNN